MTQPFYVKDCALAVLSTGEAAGSLSELKERLSTIPSSSLYYHFWGRRLRPSFGHPELHNDFALWTYLCLHDKVLSERLGIIDPTDFADLEDLRGTLLHVLSERLQEETHFVAWPTQENKFHFLESIIVVFDASTTIDKPADLKIHLPSFTHTSLFYHFIDARRRTASSRDDFSVWLQEEGGPEYDELVNKIQHIDPYFLSLHEQKHKLIEIINRHFI